MTSEEHVLYHFPDARIEKRDLLYHVIIQKYELSLKESIGDGITEDRAWDEANEWILDYWECFCEEEDEEDDDE